MTPDYVIYLLEYFSWLYSDLSELFLSSSFPVLFFSDMMVNIPQTPTLPLNLSLYEQT